MLDDDLGLEEPKGSITPWYEGIKDVHRLFIEIYCNNGMVGYRAVMDAGITDDPANAAVYSTRLLRNVNIKAAKDRYLNENSATTPELVQRLTGMAMGSAEIFTVIKDDKRVIDLTTPQAIANLYLIKEIDSDGGIKLHDSKDAIKLLLQMRGELVRTHKHQGDEDNPIRNEVIHKMDLETMQNFEALLQKKITGK